MGDRAMCEIKTTNGSLYIYTHWSGSELPVIAKTAFLRAKPRWDDEPYCLRILIDQITKSARDGETGFGLSLKPEFEDEYNSDKPSVIVDIPKKTIEVIREKLTTEVLNG